MPSGHHIPNHKLRDIAAGYLDLHMTPQLILQTFFGEEQVSHRPSLRWITRLCRRLTHESRLSFSTGPFKKLGRKRSQLLPFEATCLLDLFSSTNCKSLRKLHGDFKRAHFINPDLAPSYETIVKFSHNHRYSRKVMERLSYLAR